ncbi:Asp23/Gls24 family envelope stress response protein, partial [Burkholderia multivorans]|uniref:Asp23/Gls24 family envelope stress response protein n=1 Tax=Burkholderia multivorans TaxID=87883 RepID=UPI0034D3065C
MDLAIVVEYGTSIVDVAEAIRRNVIRAVEQGTGLQVVEVNIDVTDVHLPDEDNDDQKKSDDQNNLSWHPPPSLAPPRRALASGSAATAPE